MNTFTLMNVNLTKESETRNGNGKLVAKFSVAENRYENGQQVTQFWNCVAFGSQASFVNQYLKKGSCVNISGELRQSKYTNKEGKTATAYEVVIDRISFAGNSSGRNTKKEPEKSYPDFPDKDLEAASEYFDPDEIFEV